MKVLINTSKNNVSKDYIVWTAFVTQSRFHHKQLRCMKAIRVLAAGILFCLIQAVSSPAQEMMAWGIGAGIWKDPVEKDLESDRIPVDLFFDIDFDTAFFRFRAGANATEEKLQFSEYEKEWEYRFMTRSFYLAYRVSKRISSTCELFGFSGAAKVFSSLYDVKGDRSFNVEYWGWVSGAGFYHVMGDVDVGLQLQSVTGTSHFDMVTVAAGSNQVLATVRYRF